MRFAKLLVLIPVATLLLAPSDSASVQHNCVRAEGLQNYVVSAKNAGLIWTAIGKVGVKEPFMRSPNYDLIQYLYANDVITDAGGEMFAIAEGGSLHVYSFSNYKKIRKTSAKLIKGWHWWNWAWPENTSEALFLVSKKEDLAIARLDLTNGKGTIFPLGSKRSGYKSSAFDPTATRIAIGFTDGSIEIYSTADGRLITSYRVHSGEVWAIAFHPVQQLVASSGGNNRIIYYDLSKRQTRSVLPGYGHFLKFTKNGGALIIANYERLGLYDLDGKPIETAEVSTMMNFTRFQILENKRRVYLNTEESICWFQFDKWSEIPANVSLPPAPQEPMYEGKPLSHYVNELQKDDITVRLMALQSLGRIGPEARIAIPAMLELWDVKEGETEGFWRGPVIQALAALGPDAREALPKIVDAMTDPNAAVRGMAATACAEMHAAAKDAVPALIELTRDPVITVKEAAIVALGEIGPDAKEAIPVLKILKKDKNKMIQFRAKDAMKKIEGK